MLKTKLLISLFACGFMALAGSQLEARHHSHSSFNMQINAGTPVTPGYAVVPAHPPASVIVHSPVYAQTPTVVHTSHVVQRPPVMHRHNVVETSTVVQHAIVPTPVAVYPHYYTAPTYEVYQQPVVVTQKVRPSFNLGFNWGFFFR